MRNNATNTLPHEIILRKPEADKRIYFLILKSSQKYDKEPIHTTG